MKPHHSSMLKRGSWIKRVRGLLGPSGSTKYSGDHGRNHQRHGSWTNPIPLTFTHLHICYHAGQVCSKPKYLDHMLIIEIAKPNHVPVLWLPSSTKRWLSVIIDPIVWIDILVAKIRIASRLGSKSDNGMKVCKKMPHLGLHRSDQSKGY